MNGFSIPGSEQAGKKVMPVDIGDCAAEKPGNFFGRGSLAGHHGEKRRKIEGVDSFQLLHRCFNLVAARVDQRAPIRRGSLIQHSENRSAFAEEGGMFAEEQELGSAVNFRAVNEVRYRKRQVLMDCRGFGKVIDTKTDAAQAQPKIRIFSDSKLGIEGAHVQDGLACDAQIASDEIGVFPILPGLQRGLRKEKRAAR